MKPRSLVLNGYIRDASGQWRAVRQFGKHRVEIVRDRNGKLLKSIPQ